MSASETCYSRPGLCASCESNGAQGGGVAVGPKGNRVVRQLWIGAIVHRAFCNGVTIDTTDKVKSKTLIVHDLIGPMVSESNASLEYRSRGDRDVPRWWRSIDRDRWPRSLDSTSPSLPTLCALPFHCGVGASKCEDP